jgi:23S rRNA pseudouridine2605 synthase
MRSNNNKDNLSRPGSRKQTKQVTKGGAKPAVRKTGEKDSGVSAGKPKSKIYKTKTRSESKVSKKRVYSEDVRLNRFIANAGICSRREADKFIAAGLVSVNGTITTEMGVKVKPGDDIRFDGRRLTAEKKVYILLNKPKDYVTTTDDPHAERTVMELVKDACVERIYPVGRLDRNTTGVLLFTNDGDLSKKLTHPSHKMKKVYQVTLDKALNKNHMVQIADGVELEDGHIAADAISYINAENKTEIGIEIHSGRNRIVRRIFEHLGYHVRKLDRVYFAGLTKKNLPRGKWRALSGKEIQYLKMQ